MASISEKPNTNTVIAASNYAPYHPEDRRGSLTEPCVGELVPGEAEEGGLGRHLGVWSTTFLM